MGHKKICDWSQKDLGKKMPEFYAQVDAPKFVCLKCVRVANKKKDLCKPQEMCKDKKKD